MPGPAPTPLKVLKARGSWRGKANKAEPQPEPGMPTCPNWLDAEGRRCWKWAVRQLRLMGLLTKADRAALASLCQQWSVFVRASRLFNETPDNVDAAEMMELRRLASIANDANAAFLKCCQQFGLTPSARARLQTPAKESPAKDGKARFFASEEE